VQTTSEGSSMTMDGWNTIWPRMPNITPSLEIHKLQESMVPQSKLKLVEEIFQDINKQMLETNYTLNLEQLLFKLFLS
jgi:hypothetical protein